MTIVKFQFCQAPRKIFGAPQGDEAHSLGITGLPFNLRHLQAINKFLSPEIIRGSHQIGRQILVGLVSQLFDTDIIAKASAVDLITYL